MSGTIVIDSQVPFGYALSAWLHLRAEPLNHLIHHNSVEKAYLAWETVRKESNPYFEQGTGFEGYFVGRCDDPEAALAAILDINQRILEAIARLYRFEFGFRSRLFRTLLRERCDAAALHLWSDYFGAELARLRAQILTEPEAQEFQRQTYRIVSMLPPMIYHERVNDVTQTYAIGAFPTPQYTRLDINFATLKPRQQDAWLVARNIGAFGHPLVRRMLDRVPFEWRGS